MSRGLAEWWPVDRVTADDVHLWIGTVSPRVVDALLSVTDGRARWIADLWADWRRREVVLLPDDVRPLAEPCWDFAPGQQELALAPAKDLLVTRLAECLGGHSNLHDREGSRPIVRGN
jgi:hypothetical protein